MRPPSTPTSIPINPEDRRQVKVMKALYNALIDHREPKTNRTLIQLFMCLPSRKDFPGYYSIIEKPIAMNKIRERIEQEIYADEQSCLDDFKLMFNNCKFFNEDDSQIYKDAATLENVLVKKKEELFNEFNSKQNSFKESNNKSDSTNNHNHVSNVTIHKSPTKSVTPTSNITITPATTQSTIISINTNTNNNNNNISNSTANDITSSSSKANSNNDIHNSNNQNTDNDKNSNSNHTTTSNHRNSTLDHNQTSNDQHNGNEELESGSVKVNHNHHNDVSMDSSSNLSADLLASTPVEKCSLNTRRGRNSDAPKRQLLTGYIIYASEIRKQVIDKNPNQNFGDISRLVGNEWKALPHDIRSKYDQRALIHNKRVREKAQRDLYSSEGRISNGLHTPKLTKRKLAKLAKEQMRQHHLSISGHDDTLTQSPRISQEHASTPIVSQTPNSTFKQLHNQHSQPQTHSHATTSKVTTVESTTQTAPLRFVEPPAKKRLVYSESFKRYIESLQVPNKDILVEETTPDRTPTAPSIWLGAGIGRHESPEAALWALRDFMLQDAVTMRRSMEPYL